MPDPRPRRGPPGRGQPGRGPADSGPVGASSPGTGPRGTGRRGVSPQGAGPRGPGLPDDRDRRRRELSQNYLRSDGVAAAQFLHQVDPDPGGLCLEVGAGEGILTVGLAAMFREVVAYELDPEAADRLRARLRRGTHRRPAPQVGSPSGGFPGRDFPGGDFPGGGFPGGDFPGRDFPAGRPPGGPSPGGRTAGLAGVTVITGDFLAARPPREPFQVAGNAPFSVTSPIVDWCLGSRTMTSATLITQLEYARKRTGAYGRWSLRTVSTWPRVQWELRGRIGRDQFRPVPRVDAGILRITRRPEPLIPAARLPAYERMVQTGFTGVGGSLLASLRRDYPAPRLAAAFRAAGVDRAAVVAFVSPGQWIELFRILDHVM